MPKSEDPEFDIQKYKPTKLEYLNPNTFKFDDSLHPFDIPKGEKYEELKDSIKRLGVLQIVFLRHDWTIIDGRTRSAICQELDYYVPAIRFQKELPPGKEQEIIYHLIFTGRNVSAGDRDAAIEKRLGEMLMKATIKSVHQLTGIHESTLKKLRVKIQNRKRFENIGVSEQKLKEGLRYYIKWDKYRQQENEAKSERQKLETKLEEIAPMSWWRKKGWEDKKGSG
ncbi:ParB-like protein [Leptospira interrogans serovar Hebdomadis str. R499]|uniref:Chromosome partitioning protein ParB n=2 Tax=Leptospira interrogans TaxID=173 RepID=A0AAP9WFR7_LEPIR|nr:ParB/RepB/Spo0J family partition protein [Leptospira interrogans]EMM94258.1 ParB-like protein [Leptospira interrogans serovar Zanoni str. LT2156]EMN38319.1 ParB-like protein [Leptospira interrogans str. L0996]KGE21834.1 chromosomal partitioning protein ParB [Leptospira interrogans serovar Lai]MBE0302211.1 chromosome partitioning protein ParB [Leptospira interrogans serovar Yeoncheon]QOI45166.1 chromosome partitioning protein ParB [Leptospira interrogans serovar Canicola]